MLRKLLVFLAFALVAAAAYQLRRWDFDWPLFFDGLLRLHSGWVLAFVAVTFLGYVIRAVRWQLLLAPVRSIDLSSLTWTTTVGFSAIYLMGRAGEVVRPLWIARREHVPFAAAAATIVIERVFDTLMLILLFALTLLTVELPSAADSAIALMKTAAGLLLAVSVSLIGAILVFRATTDLIVGYLSNHRVAGLVRTFGEGLRFIERPRNFILTVCYSLVVWVLIVLQFWFLMRGLKFDFSLAASTLVMVGVGLGSLAQVPGIGGGFQAGFIFCMTTFFGVAAETAIAASLVAWVLSYAPTIMVGALYLVSQGVSAKELQMDSLAEQTHEMPILRSPRG